MKKILSIIMFFLATAIVFTGCKKDDKTPVLDITATVNPTWVKAPAPDTHYILVQDSADVVLTDFEWTEVVYAISDLPAPLYTLQLLFTEVDSTGSHWGETVDLFTTSEKMISLTYGTLNKNILGEIGSDFSADTVVTVGFRLKANVNANDVSSYVDAFSEIVSVTVTPYTSGGVDYPSLYVPGGYQGWSPGTAPQVFDFNGDGIYTGYVYFPEGSLEFKFTNQPDWDGTNYGAGATEFALDIEPTAGNLMVPEAGGYQLEINTNDLTWNYGDGVQNWGVIGQWLDWASDIDMIYYPELQELSVTVENIPAAADQRFKFRANDDWAVNLGANDPDDGFLVQGGADIPIPDGGTITMTLKFTTPEPSYSWRAE
jgi:hypothetical protein